DAGAPVLDDAALDSLRSLDPDGRLPDRLVDLFLSESASRVDQLREAAREGDTDRVRRLAHGFKGSAGYFGASRLLTVCRDLEIHAPDASPAELAAAAEEVAGCLSEAEAAINAVRERERTA
ncbi:MAG TPA: Hpt domain-containing protein, partial [Acidimicrobiales bacterium]|nr:Hpt domain-containing protein [Acidimicrobiales bacterium]